MSSPMIHPGPAKKVTIFVGEDVHVHGRPLYLTILNYLFEQNVSGATVTKGVAGFGLHHHLHTARILELSENLPMKIEFIESAETVDVVLPRLSELVTHGVIDVQDTTIVKSG